MYSAKCIQSHLKTISAFQSVWKEMRYEEEVTINFAPESVNTLVEYVIFIRDFEKIMSDQKTYGHPQDENYNKRINLLKSAYEKLFIDPKKVIDIIESYNEDLPQRSVFLDGYNKFSVIRKALLKVLKNLKIINEMQNKHTVRELFLEYAKLKEYEFVEMLLLPVPPNAKPIDDPDSKIQLPYGIVAKVYDLEGSEANIYLIENTYLENIPPQIIPYIKQLIEEETKAFPSSEDMAGLFENKIREYRNYFNEKALQLNITLTPQQALGIARECACWTVGLGAPIENLALDKENITDIYIDGQNSPIYIEHRKFGLCHTIYRYNLNLLEHAFRNIVLFSGEGRKFDDKNPVVDVVLKRLAMRCHLQRPPATFSELQGALRIMRALPFTYCQYLNYYAMTPFYAGYDDLMVSLGCSEAVLGLKGVGKTSFTAAKIAAIGTKMRILPIQDIEEIPVKAYRKRGFHIGAMKVQSSDIEGMHQIGGNELDLLSMANASLRMGDACIIINEIRSRTTIQGVINILNTQPGVFILYNLHAQSLKDVQDRLELVFGIPSASMYATERYTFLKKVRFGRQKTVNRVLGEAYETDINNKEFVQTFGFKKRTSMKDSALLCYFLKNPEAHSWTLDNLDLTKLKKNLNFSAEPPVVKKRANDNGFELEDYIMDAFFKAKIYYDIKEIASRTNLKKLLEIDFVLKVTAEANKLLVMHEKKYGGIDYSNLVPEWNEIFKQLAKEEITLLKTNQ
ncbi:MAG: ATPase, T2SS/T4P/T4SS family [Candidatus Micrarchaeota archaeon]|nr:ATPase, T2SS/T4P/T4SS family [Candidatus Micrarchaeota archaeon]